MSDIAIRVENLGKRYRIGAEEKRPDNLWQATKQLVASPFDYLRRITRPPTEEETLWALKDVSFEVKRGEVVGIIGRNGAGKSTLLKILSRITEPTHGRAVINGRVGSLLEVGTGFHPELTGRENIYLNGAILGMKREEIDRKFDEIVDFSGVEKFIDTPVKRYSSGMRVRLAFSVAAHLEPEILLVDEVLAVGDAEFQKKCLGKMGDVAKEGRTVLFVSHNMGAVKRLCPRAMLFEEGVVQSTGLSEEVITVYLNQGATISGFKKWRPGFSNQDVDEVCVHGVMIKNSSGRVTSKIQAGEHFVVEIELSFQRALPLCRVGIILSTFQGATVFESYDSDMKEYSGERKISRQIIRCIVPGNFLNIGRYTLSINVGIPNVKNLALLEHALIFDIEDVGAVGSEMLSRRKGIIRPKLHWQIMESSK